MPFADGEDPIADHLWRHRQVPQNLDWDQDLAFRIADSASFVNENLVPGNMLCTSRRRVPVGRYRELAAHRPGLSNDTRSVSTSSGLLV